MTIPAKIAGRAGRAAALLLLCSFLESARAGTWTEVGDAPATLPGQATIGSGALTVITGHILALRDANTYQIYISDPANFSATVDSTNEPFTGALDTMMFLFDSTGKGLAANDDRGNTLPNHALNIYSWLPQGNSLYNSLSPGLYYLSISSYQYVPANTFGNAIFPTVSDTEGSIVPPGNTSPLTQWIQTDSEAGNDSGAYTIDLSGATFAVVPEPSSILLALLGLGGLLFRPAVRSLRRRRATIAS